MSRGTGEVSVAPAWNPRVRFSLNTSNKSKQSLVGGGRSSIAAT